MLRIQFLGFGAALLSLCSVSSYLHYAYAIPTPPPSPQDLLQKTKTNPRLNCKGSLFLPFSQKKFDPAETPRLSLRLGKNPSVHHVQMDTGSTGFLIDPAWIDGYEPSAATSLGYEAGHEYLSSSHKIYTGFWVPLDVSFMGLGSDEAVSRVSVLAVDQVITCPWYRRADGNTCRPRPDGESRNMSIASGAGVRYVCSNTRLLKRCRSLLVNFHVNLCWIPLFLDGRWIWSPGGWSITRHSWQEYVAEYSKHQWQICRLWVLSRVHHQCSWGKRHLCRHHQVQHRPIPAQPDKVTSRLRLGERQSWLGGSSYDVVSKWLSICGGNGTHWHRSCICRFHVGSFPTSLQFIDETLCHIAAN